MPDELNAYLRSLQTKPVREHAQWRWEGNELRLDIDHYLATSLPPLPLVTSVRALVVRGGDVLCLLNAEGERHVIPGGRREPGEELLATLERELLEETGWTFSQPVLIGVMHHRHHSPRPSGYPYPYPEFLQVVYAVTARVHDANRRLAGDHEVAARFVPIEAALELEIPAGQKQYLTALQSNRGSERA